MLYVHKHQVKGTKPMIYKRYFYSLFSTHKSLMMLLEMFHCNTKEIKCREMLLFSQRLFNDARKYSASGNKDVYRDFKGGEF